MVLDALSPGGGFCHNADVTYSFAAFLLFCWMKAKDVWLTIFGCRLRFGRLCTYISAFGGDRQVVWKQVEFLSATTSTLAFWAEFL
jgi:hypothetical protein